MRVGDTIAGYDIVAKLKAGGMAALYLGKRHGAAGFAKHVAIKVVHEHLADDDEFVRMFLDEARITARIEHPNVVHVHDLGHANDHYFLVMEYVPSVALTQLLRAVAKLGRRLSPEVATWIAMQMAAGLHAAHETTDDAGNALSIVHRDVSPKNILLAYKGYVKVIDFGIAKAAGRATKTQGGLLKGTFRYMSPEQARGRELDARSDLYSLGICLWEMLVMRRLFDADNDLSLLDLVREPQIVPPGQLVSVPPALDKLVMAALAKNPDDRPADCDEMRMELAMAVPGAMRITAKQIGELIGASMADQVSADSDPSVASALGKPVTVQVPASVLDKMTRVPDEILIDGAMALQPAPIVVTPTGSHMDLGSGVKVKLPPSLVTPTPSHPGLRDQGLMDQGLMNQGMDQGLAEPTEMTESSDSIEVEIGDTIPAPARRNRVPMIAALALAFGALLGGVAYLQVSSAEPTSEPLPPLQTALTTATDDSTGTSMLAEPTVEVVAESDTANAPTLGTATPTLGTATPTLGTENETSEMGSETVEASERAENSMTGMTGDSTIVEVNMRRRTTMRRGERNTPMMRSRTTMTDDALIVGW